jgi:hypothetical protein
MDPPFPAQYQINTKREELIREQAKFCEVSTFGFTIGIGLALFLLGGIA